MARRTTEIETDHALASVWGTLWDESAWTVATDAVEAVEILDRGDRHGNGRLRRVHQHRRWWDATIMIERTERVAHQRSVDAIVHHHRADLRHGWRLHVEAVDAERTRLVLDEEVDVDEPRYPGETRLLTGRLLAFRPTILEALFPAAADDRTAATTA